MTSEQEKRIGDIRERLGAVDDALYRLVELRYPILGAMERNTLDDVENDCRNLERHAKRLRGEWE